VSKSIAKAQLKGGRRSSHCTLDPLITLKRLQRLSETAAW